MSTVGALSAGEIVEIYAREGHMMEASDSTFQLQKASPLSHPPRDYNILCGAPPYYPSSQTWCSDYDYPLRMLLAGGDLYFNSTAGPAACQSVACDKYSGAAVYFCNDNPTNISVLFETMGEAATATIDKCCEKMQKGDFVNRGQAFSPDNWNVFLGLIHPCTMVQDEIGG
ncbi:hypothetical protein GGR56DRAFT_694156 [Xylariaceae sp. FL0804]|nr:hypothetical protein GGR56DRAFT_694156 [Xylariaceae sp. FL0804]